MYLHAFHCGALLPCQRRQPHGGIVDELFAGSGRLRQLALAQLLEPAGEAWQGGVGRGR